MGAAQRRYDIDPANLDADGIAESQTVNAGSNLSLNGALCDLGTALRFDIADAYSDGVGGVKLLFDAAGDINTAVFTITGKDENGISVTETVTGVTTTAVSTTRYYSQVTQIAVSVATATSVFVGTVTGAVASRTIPLNVYSDVAAAVSVSGLTGTCDWSIEQTFDDLRTPPSSIYWTAPTAAILTTTTANAASFLDVGASGVRLILNSYTNGAELQFNVSYNPYR